MKKLLFVAYRDNELFEKYVPAILSHVPAEIRIEKVIFPAGTEEEVMAQSLFSKLRAVGEPFYYLSDGTCSYGSKGVYEALKLKQKDDLEILNILDKVFEEVVAQTMIGGEREVATESNFKVTVAKIINLLLPNGPSKLIIVTECIADHIHDPLRERFRLEGEEYRLNDKGFATFISASFKDLFPAAEVIEVAFFNRIKQPDLDNPTAVIMVDRHHEFSMSVDSWDIGKWKYMAKLFMLPFENSLAHLEQLGKVKVDFGGLSLFNRLGLPVE